MVFNILCGDYPSHLFPGSGWVASRVVLYRVFFLFSYNFLVISVLVFTLYFYRVCCAFFWRFYFLKFTIVVILTLIIIFTLLMFITRIHLRCCVDCKNGDGIVAVITYFCGIFNTTVCISVSSDSFGIKLWVSYSSITPGNSDSNSGWIPGYVFVRPSRSSSVSQSKKISAVPKLQIGPIYFFLVLFTPPVDCVYDLMWHGVQWCNYYTCAVLVCAHFSNKIIWRSC